MSSELLRVKALVTEKEAREGMVVARDSLNREVRSLAILL